MNPMFVPFCRPGGMPLADTPADHIGTLLLAALLAGRPGLLKMKVKRWKPYLPIICFPGVTPSLGKSKLMP
ncbi:molecular chaperone [Salmonella bongori]|nr:molecular chaperone [Salmonella bongori]